MMENKVSDKELVLESIMVLKASEGLAKEVLEELSQDDPGDSNEILKANRIRGQQSNTVIIDECAKNE
jgi:hypothetical protein